jgi:hypothetical protein
VKVGNFNDWYTNTFKAYSAGEPLNFEAHHVIPVNVLQKNRDLQDLLKWAKENGKSFDFNGIDNGIPLPKKSIKFDQSGHANHPQYDNYIREHIEDIVSDNKASNNEKFTNTLDFISNTKDKLRTSVLLGNNDVNNIMNF